MGWGGKFLIHVRVQSLILVSTVTVYIDMWLLSILHTMYITVLSCIYTILSHVMHIRLLHVHTVHWYISETVS